MYKQCEKVRSSTRCFVEGCGVTLVCYLDLHLPLQLVPITIEVAHFISTLGEVCSICRSSCDEVFRRLASGRWLYLVLQLTSNKKKWPTRYNWNIVALSACHTNPVLNAKLYKFPYKQSYIHVAGTDVPPQKYTCVSWKESLNSNGQQC